MHHLIPISILILLNAVALHPIKAERNSFGFDLFHRDSKFSPFYNQSMTESELSRKSFLRSLNRLKQSNSIMYGDGKFIGSTDVTYYEGDYLMTMYIGNENLGTEIPIERRGEPIELRAYPSMSSYLTWVRCGPCIDCENQDHELLYDPRNSDTYRTVGHDSSICEAMEHTSSSNSGDCEYMYSSSDNKYSSSGVLSTETFFLKDGSSVNNKKIPGIVFGCDNLHDGNFKHGAQAVVGLGQGSTVSLVYQLGKNNIGEKFSYCLVGPLVSHRSKIRFGSDIKLYNQTIEYRAQIIKDPDFPSFYYLSLESIFINEKKAIDIPKTYRHMRVDIQTSATTLARPIYNQLRGKLIELAGNVTPVPQHHYGTCFLKSDLSNIRGLELHFKSSNIASRAVLHLHPNKFFIEIDHRYSCLTILPAADGTHVSVLGYQAQLDVQMIFNPPGKVLMFAPLQCTQFK